MDTFEVDNAYTRGGPKSLKGSRISLIFKAEQ